MSITPTIQVQVNDVLYMAHRLAGLVTEAGRGFSNSQQADAILALQSLIDSWGIQQYIACYAEERTVFTLVPQKGSYLIGQDGNEDISVVRPVSIRAAGIIFMNTSPAVETPMRILTAQEWAALSPKELTSTIPYMLYYQPTVPDGTVFPWPVPITAYNVALYAMIGLQNIATAADVLVMPPGYQEALEYNLAVKLADLNPLRAKISAGTLRKAAARKEAIMTANAGPVLMQSEAGACGHEQSRGRYNIINNSWSR